MLILKQDYTKALEKRSNSSASRLEYKTKHSYSKRYSDVSSQPWEVAMRELSTNLYST